MKLDRSKRWDYFILVARVLLAWTFIRYGWAKMVDGQFGLNPEELDMTVRELSSFRLSWYLFDMQPFKAFIGISQLICGVLLLIPRTVLLGAFMFLPIVTTILIIDITFLKMPGFYPRLGSYILLDFLILLHYKDRMLQIWAAVWHNMKARFRYRWWQYLILPILAIGLEIGLALPTALFNFVSDPAGVWARVVELWQSILG
ncbi:MAG: DoxX family membrane protein [Bacteroidota bacterium]